MHCVDLGESSQRHVYNFLSKLAYSVYKTENEPCKVCRITPRRSSALSGAKPCPPVSLWQLCNEKVCAYPTPFFFAKAIHYTARNFTSHSVWSKISSSIVYRSHLDEICLLMHSSLWKSFNFRARKIRQSRLFSERAELHLMSDHFSENEKAMLVKKLPAAAQPPRLQSMDNKFDVSHRP